MEIFYREKAFHAGEKIRKNDFTPSEKFSCYAPADWLKEGHMTWIIFDNVHVWKLIHVS